MHLATVRLPTGQTAAVRLDGEEAVETGAPDVGDLLRDPHWKEAAATADGQRYPRSELDYAPLIPNPDKIVCVGLNYRPHVAETGDALPSYPTLFAKYRGALIGAYDPIILPTTSHRVDWEAELALIIGAPTRNASLAEAEDVMAGYTIMNDVSVRDWQQRTTQWLQGKTFEGTTPLGPSLVTRDDPDITGPELTIECEVDGRTVQRANTCDLIFPPAALISYISYIITLLPGDVIATGTPSGIGDTRHPPEYLHPGTVLTTRIEGLGATRNVCVASRPSLQFP